MKITYEELQQLEELVREGTPLDEAVMEEARAACGGLKFIQTGPWVDNVVFAQPSGGVGIMVSVAIQNVSNRVIPLKEARLEMPWPDADFQWLKKPSSKEVREWGGYFLAASGPCRFDPSEVLNHRFGRDSKLYPREFLEGLLLGEGPM